MMTGSRTLTWLTTTALIAALGLALSLTGLDGPLRSLTARLTEPVAGTISGVTSPIAGALGDLGRYGALREENRGLHEENERLRADLAKLREEQSRAADLEDLVGLRTVRPSDSFAFGTVIAREPNALRQSFAINRGSNDGVREGMPVLGRGGALVGTIDEVQATTAWVRLLTDADSRVNAVIQESRAMALVMGRPGGELTMEFVAQGLEVKPGDTVVTSGLGGLYPAGLLIGRVADVEGNALDLFKKVRIEPAVGLSALEHVAVLTSFQPLKLSGR